MFGIGEEAEMSEVLQAVLADDTIPSSPFGERARLPNFGVSDSGAFRERDVRSSGVIPVCVRLDRQ